MKMRLNLDPSLERHFPAEFEPEHSDPIDLFVIYTLVIFILLYFIIFMFLGIQA